MTADEPVEARGQEQVVAAINELRRKLLAGEDTGSLMVPDPSRWERLMYRLESRWGARRYLRMIGADLPMRERRRRALKALSKAPVRRWPKDFQ